MEEGKQPQTVLCIAANNDHSYTAIGTNMGYYLLKSGSDDLTNVVRKGKRCNIRGRPSVIDCDARSNKHRGLRAG